MIGIGRRMVLMTAALALLTVPGCGPAGEPEDGAEPGPEARELEAVMIDSDGVQVGFVVFAAEEDDAVHVRGHLTLPQAADGPRGFHIHETGRCDPPDFQSADGHYDPHGAAHGGPHDPPGERHAGDLGNIEFGAEGQAEIDIVAPGVGLDELVGLAVVVHEGEDDLETDPTGESGARIACGVIRE